MRQMMLTLGLAALLAHGCTQAPAPVAVAARTSTATTFQLLVGRVAQVEVLTEVAGSTVALNVIGNMQVDLGNVLGLALSRRVLVGVEQRDAANPAVAIAQGLNFLDVKANGLSLGLGLTKAQLTTKVPVINNVTGKAMDVEVDLELTPDDEDPEVVRNRSSLTLGGVTISSSAYGVVKGATAKGHVKVGPTDIRFPLANGQLQASLRSSFDLDRTTTTKK
jgi:hypothetical protein